MSVVRVLNEHTFIDGVTASTVSNWIPLDFRYQEGLRSVAGTKVSADTCVLELGFRTSAGATTPTVIATATAWVSGPSEFSTVLQGPAPFVRVRVIGSAGAATVVGTI